MDKTFEVWVTVNGEEELYAGADSLGLAEQYYRQVTMKPSSEECEAVTIYEITREVYRQESL